MKQSNFYVYQGSISMRLAEIGVIAMTNLRKLLDEQSDNERVTRSDVVLKMAFLSISFASNCCS